MPKAPTRLPVSPLKAYTYVETGNPAFGEYVPPPKRPRGRPWKVPPVSSVSSDAPSTEDGSSNELDTHTLSPSSASSRRTRRAFVPDEEKTDSYKRSRQTTAENYARKSAEARDIAPLHVDRIDWERRLACQHDLTLFEKTYLGEIFNLEFSEIHHYANARITQCVRDYGRFAIAMPRGNGKTAQCRGGIIWSICYGFKKYIVLISSNDTNALSSFKIVKTMLESPLLVQDFPEICYPIARLDQNVYKTRGQIYNGHPTYLNWGQIGEAQLPSLLLNDEIAEVYNRHQPGFLRQVKAVTNSATGEQADCWLAINAATVFESYSIEGSIRGVNHINPITKQIYRPDLALLDDVQRDANKDSPTAHQRLLDQIGGSITNLSNPDSSLSILMACTLMKEDDVASIYTDPEKEPDFGGVRFPLVTSWPSGITDYDILLDTEPGRLWNEYGEKRRESLREHNDIRGATEFYLANQSVLTEGFEVAWPARYDKRITVDAKQHAMELRFKNPDSFAYEMQNKPRKMVGTANMISAAQLRQRQMIFPKGIAPPDASILVAHIDVSSEIMWYVVFACNYNFDGVIVDYGTWPELHTRVFTKTQCDMWSMITSAFFQAHPQHRDKCEYTESGKPRAPDRAKIYWALGQTTKHILSKSYYRDDASKTPMRISRIGIDTRWGEVTEAIKQFIRDAQIPQLLNYQGQYFGPRRKQLEEYKATPGWIFETQKHPSLKEARWVFRQQPDGGWLLQADVSRLKDSVFQQLGSPMGSPGAIAMYHAPESEHDLFSKHICDSEYPEPEITPGLTKNLYINRPGFDNDFLDCLAACFAHASFEGACLRTSSQASIVRERLSLRQRYEQKRGLPITGRGSR